MGSPDSVSAGFGQAEVADLALGDEIANRAGHVLDGYRGVDSVLVEQVDVIGAEPAQAVFRDRANMFGAAVGALDRAALNIEAELGGDHHLVPAAFERPAQQLLICERAIDFRGVEKGDSKFDRPVDRGDRLRIIEGTVGLAHAHAAQPKGRNFQAMAAKRALHQHHLISRSAGRARNLQTIRLAGRRFTGRRRAPARHGRWLLETSRPLRRCNTEPGPLTKEAS